MEQIHEALLEETAINYSAASLFPFDSYSKRAGTASGIFQRLKSWAKADLEK